MVPLKYPVTIYNHSAFKNSSFLSNVSLYMKLIMS